MTRLARLALLFSFAAGCAEPAFAQTNNAHGNIGSSQAQQEMSNALTNQNLFGAPRQLLVNFAVCSATLNLGGLRVDNTSNPGTLYFCNGSAWTAVSTGGGSVAFSSITGGTNTSAAMVLGTGSSLSSTGGTASFLDGADFSLKNIADNTKVFEIDLSNATTATTQLIKSTATANIMTFGMGNTGGTGASTTAFGSGNALGTGAGNVLLGTGNTAGSGGSNIQIGNNQSGSAVVSSISIGLGTTPVANTIIIGNTSGNGTVPDSYVGVPTTTAAAPLNTTLHGQGASGTNIIGASETIAGGLSTGNADPGVVYTDQGLFSVTTGSTLQTAAHHAGFGLYKTLTNNTVTSVLNMTDASNTVAGSIIKYSCLVFNGTDLQIEIGEASCSVQNKAGVFSGNACTKFGTQQPSPTSGTLAVTLTVTGANPAVVQVNCNSSLTPSAGYPIWGMDFSNLGNQAMTVVP